MELSIRISSEEATFDDIIALVDPVTDRYIIGLEQANSRHFQCYIRYIAEDDLKYSKLRYRFKSAGYTGNASISITKMRNTNLMIYVLKDGNFQYKGFTEEEIQTLSEQSYDKPKSFKELKREVDQYYLETRDHTGWLRKRIQLLIDNHIGYNRVKLIQEFKTLEMESNPKSIELEIINFFNLVDK